jgi:hypothetical protein
MAHIVDTDMAESLLRRTRFKEAYLYNVSFSGSDLSDYSSLSSAKLHNVSLINTDLESADLSGVEFSETDLTAVDFATTDLLGANLSDTVGLSMDSVSGALWDETTCLPWFGATQHSEPFILEFSAALGRRLGGSATEWTARMHWDLPSPDEIDLVVETDHGWTTVELGADPSDEARRALLELDVANPDVSRRRFKWDAQSGTWAFS